jgi:hypothetical protein
MFETLVERKVTRIAFLHILEVVGMREFDSVDLRCVFTMGGRLEVYLHLTQPFSHLSHVSNLSLNMQAPPK